MNRALLESADAGGTILAPNTELAAALFDALERAYRDSGREIWRTPRVRDFGGWLRERHIERQFTDSSTPRCLTDVEEREVWHTVVLEREPGEPYLDPSGAVRAARRARRAMHEYAIPPRAIAADGGEESLMFLDWNARFEERCRAVRCIDADRLPMSMDCASPLAWIESPHWRPVARGWLQAQIGPALEPSEASPPAAADGLGASRLLGAGSRAEEFAAMADWARQALLANPAFRAWICVPDLARCRSELVDAFDAALAPQRFSLDETSEGRALCGGRRHAACRLCAGARGARSVGGERGTGILHSIQRPAALAGASGVGRGGGRGVDSGCGIAQPRAERNSTRGLAGSSRKPRRVRSPWDPSVHYSACRRAHGFSGELGGQHPMSRWVRLWVAAFESAPWSLRRRWSSGEYQSAERFRELLAALAGGDPVFGTQSRAAAESILRRAARDTAFQMQTGVPADLGQRSINRSLAHLRWLVGRRMLRGALAAARRSDPAAAGTVAKAAWGGRGRCGGATAVRRGSAAALARARTLLRVQLR